MNYIDQSGIYVIQEIINGLSKNKKEIYFSGLQTQPKLMFQKMGIFDSESMNDKVFNDYAKCIEQIKKNL